MAPARPRRLRNTVLALALTGFGLWLTGSALWQLGKTAVFVHESVVVTGTVIDVRQKPFESWADTLGKGNWSWPGEVSYQPIVRFTLPGGINAIRLDLAADNRDYRTGEDISIISPPAQPGKARINRWKFLWGAPCLRLAAGAFLTLIGGTLLQRLKGKRPATPAEQPKKATADKSPRRRKPTGGSSPRRKKADAAPADAKKPRRSRRKKRGEQQPELPF